MNQSITKLRTTPFLGQNSKRKPLPSKTTNSNRDRCKIDLEAERKHILADQDRLLEKSEALAWTSMGYTAAVATTVLFAAPDLVNSIPILLAPSCLLALASGKAFYDSLKLWLRADALGAAGPDNSRGR